MAQSESKGFGAAIRQARQALGTELSEVAHTTRIQLRYLEALEAEDWERVPRGVIGRGFVRVLARELRLPPDELLQRYRAARGGEDAEPERSFPETDWKVDLPSPSRRKPAAWAAAALLVVAVAIWRFGPWEPQVPAPQPEAHESPAEVAAPREPPPKAPLEAASPRPQRPAAAATPVAGSPLARPAPAARGRLELEASQRVWIRVSPAGSPPQEQVLKPGGRVAFDLGGEAELKIGNAGAVRLYWNGVPVGVAGKGSQVVTLAVPRDLPAAGP